MACFASNLILSLTLFKALEVINRGPLNKWLPGCIGTVFWHMAPLRQIAQLTETGKAIHTTWQPPSSGALYDAHLGLPTGQGGQGQLDPVDPEVGAGRVVPRPAVLHQRLGSPEGPQADATYAAYAPWRVVVGGVVGGQWLKVKCHLLFGLVQC